MHKQEPLYKQLDRNVHRFTCDKLHEFYIPIKMPVPIPEVVELLRVLECPVCHTKNVHIDARPFIAEPIKIFHNIDDMIEDLETFLADNPRPTND